MTGLAFAILLGLYFLLFPCKGLGVIISPRDGTKLTFVPGSSRNITWTFDDAKAAYRDWSFTSSDGLGSGLLGGIVSDFEPQTTTDVLPGVNIIKPGTLALSNVDQNYNGTYTFLLKVNGKPDDTSDVIVFIAIKPTVTTCSSPVTVIEGNDLTCECQGQGGNPAANVTWFKDDIQIGKTGKEEQTLTRRNVSAADSGTYKCVAESYPDAKFKDERLITVVVKLKFKPNETAIRLTPERSVIGESVNITCESSGLPKPRYSIIHNDTEVSSERTYTISKVNWSDAGTYQCTVENELGRNSKYSCLTVVGEKAASKKVDCESSTETVVVWHIVVSLVSGVIIGLFLSHIVSCSRRRWFINRKPGRSSEPKTADIDTTYQELDLTKINTEDNYQSLRVNAASYDAGNRAANDNDSTYTELNKTRDVENNYQSLT
ncbi:B-cell receptor CD22-like [Paramuricea clavata]|nr:B-cell receptor CD22-like [Paramuricea clavata]